MAQLTGPKDRYLVLETSRDFDLKDGAWSEDDWVDMKLVVRRKDLIWARQDRFLQVRDLRRLCSFVQSCALASGEEMLTFSALEPFFRLSYQRVNQSHRFVGHFSHQLHPLYSSDTIRDPNDSAATRVPFSVTFAPTNEQLDRFVQELSVEIQGTA
jgi:hypothetical protein